MLSTEPNNKEGKTLTKSFKIFRSGSPEEWILWRTDLDEVCVGMSITTGPARNRMIRQLLSDEPLKEFERVLAMHPTETVASTNDSLDSVAIQVFPTNSYAKQKKYIRQGIWKPKALTIRNVYTRLCELNTQLSSYPNQTGLLPEDEMKSAFISLCAPEWQQEFLKTGLNEYSSTWNSILSKAEALETAEIALVDLTPTKEDNKHEREEGGLNSGQNSPSNPKKRAKQAFFCKMHGPDQRHNTSECKVINGEIEKLKGAKKALFGKTKDSQQGAKPNWIENKKRTATSYSTEQLKEVIKMTRKKALNDARAQYEIQAEAQAQAELNAIQINDHANHELEKMRQMELFITDMVDDDESDVASDMEEEEEELTQAELDELTGSLST